MEQATARACIDCTSPLSNARSNAAVATTTTTANQNQSIFCKSQSDDDLDSRTLVASIPAGRLNIRLYRLFDSVQHRVSRVQTNLDRDEGSGSRRPTLGRNVRAASLARACLFVCCSSSSSALPVAVSSFLFAIRHFSSTTSLTSTRRSTRTRAVAAHSSIHPTDHSTVPRSLV